MILTPSPPQIDLEDMLRRYKTPRRRKKMTKIYTDMLAVVAEHARPQAILEEFTRAELSKLAEWLKPETEAACLAIITLGPELDTQIDQITADDIAAGAVATEVSLAWITTIAQEVRQTAKQGIGDRPLKVGPAYRPGIGRWPLTEAQDVVFSKLDAAAIGVTINEFKLMTPNKSTSLIIPLRKKSG